MVDRTQLERSRAIQRETGPTFHAATRLLPERIRYETYVLYAFFRVADDVVDDPDPASPADQRAELERMRAAALGGGTDDVVLDAFDQVRRRRGIDERDVEEFVDAMRRDVEPRPYATYADLESYLRGSAVAVANMMLDVMDVADPEAARPHARALAEAFQLTNFLRDVREDAVEYGRVYLPVETLTRYDATPDDVLSLDATPGVAAAVAAELERAEERYREGVAGIRHLPPDCRLGVLAAATLYAEHHRLIRARGYDVLSGRPTLSVPRRLWVLARTWLDYRRTGDAERTFYRVSPVSETPRAEGVEADDAPRYGGPVAPEGRSGPLAALYGWLPDG